MTVDPALRAAVAELDPPFAVLDLDAVHRNADDMQRRAGGTPIRIATKSVRVPQLLTELLARPGFAGLMAYTLPEALWLHGRGFRDILVGYPTVHRAALRSLAGDEAAAADITVTVDGPEQLDLIEHVVGADGPPIKVCVELDAGYRAAHGLVRVGARRSPLYTTGQVLAMVREIQRRKRFRLDGLLAYEGQIAGVADAGSGPRVRVLRVLQERSRHELAHRRARVVAAVRDIAELRFVNGGGTGSLESTSAEPAVTEIAAGSGLLAPALFDGYTRFRPTPATWFVLPVVRRPARSVVTLLGGGWIASGPTGTDRSPVIAHPPGLRYVGTEGAGEVQTPLQGRAARDLAVGDHVWLRHAKAGEPAEHLDCYQVVSGRRPIGSWPTYRGLGEVFL